MSIQENLEGLKQELSAEEKMLESIVKLEGFYKKYKTFIWGTLAVIVVAIVAYAGYNYMEQQKRSEANAVYTKLLETGHDSTLESELQAKNPNLYRAYRFHLAVQNNDQAILQEIAAGDDFFAKLASYQLASLEENPQSLGTYSANQEALKDLAKLQEAYLLLQEGKIEEGRKSLAEIGFNSPVKAIANLLEHYQGIQ